eukprot:2279889-Pleurochrysis_carterae.AAC.1
MPAEPCQLRQTSIDSVGLALREENEGLPKGSIPSGPKDQVSLASKVRARWCTETGLKPSRSF